MPTKAKTSAGKPKIGAAPRKRAKRAVRDKTGEELEHYLKEAKKIGAEADKQYVAIKKKVRDAAKDLQCKAEEIRDQAAKKIDEWLE